MGSDSNTGFARDVVEATPFQKPFGRFCCGYFAKWRFAQRLKPISYAALDGVRRTRFSPWYRPSGALIIFLTPNPGLTPWAKSCFAPRAGAVEYVNIIAPTTANLKKPD